MTDDEADILADAYYNGQPDAIRAPLRTLVATSQSLAEVANGAAEAVREIAVGLRNLDMALRRVEP